MKRLVVLAVGSSLLVLAAAIGCGGESSKYGYPEEVVDNYMKSCSVNAELSGESKKDSDKFCKCTMQELEREYSLTEFLRIEEEMLYGGLQAMPPEVGEILDACVAATVK